MNIFSYACLSLVYLWIGGQIFCPFLNLASYFVIVEFLRVFKMDYEYTSFIRYVLQIFSPSLYDLTLHSLNCTFLRTNISHFNTLTRRGGSGNRLGKAHTAGIQVLPSKKTLPPTRPGPLEAPPLSRPSAGGLELPREFSKVNFFPISSRKHSQTPRPPGGC